MMKIKVQQLPAEAEYEIDGETLASELFSTIKEQPGFGDTFTLAATGAVKISFDGTFPMEATEVT